MKTTIHKLLIVLKFFIQSGKRETGRRGKREPAPLGFHCASGHACAKASADAVGHSL
ncbi:MAG: hypothetical protein WC338_06370 [Candidatus Ratteibacteria bacterium]